LTIVLPAIYNASSILRTALLIILILILIRALGLSMLRLINNRIIYAIFESVETKDDEF